MRAVVPPTLKPKLKLEIGGPNNDSDCKKREVVALALPASFIFEFELLFCHFLQIGFHNTKLVRPRYVLY